MSSSAGAVVAGQRRRIYDAVVMKVLGATRRDVGGAFLIEYGLLGLVTAVIALIVGSIAAALVLTEVMELEFVFLPAPEVEGLQVLNRRNMKWIRLDPPKGSLILNTGDYIQRISNDFYPSTTHRVSKPRDPALRRKARITFPLNVYVWEDELLEVLPGLENPKYPPIRAIEFHTQSTSKFYGDDYAVTE